MVLTSIEGSLTAVKVTVLIFYVDRKCMNSGCFGASSLLFDIDSILSTHSQHIDPSRIWKREKIKLKLEYDFLSNHHYSPSPMSFPTPKQLNKYVLYTSNILHLILTLENPNYWTLKKPSSTCLQFVPKL